MLLSLIKSKIIFLIIFTMYSFSQCINGYRLVLEHCYYLRYILLFSVKGFKFICRLCRYSAANLACPIPTWWIILLAKVISSRRILSVFVLFLYSNRAIFHYLLRNGSIVSKKHK